MHEFRERAIRRMDFAHELQFFYNAGSSCRPLNLDLKGSA